MADAETGSVSFDNLVLSDATALTATRTLTSGENVTRGALLKLGTGTKLVAMDEYDADTDAFTVAATDADATGGDVSVNVFTFAQLSAAAVAAASGLASISTAMRNQLWLRGIHIKDTLSLD